MFQTVFKTYIIHSDVLYISSCHNCEKEIKLIVLNFTEFLPHFMFFCNSECQLSFKQANNGQY